MKWSVLKAAREWGIDRETLAKRLVRAGHEVGRGSSRAQFTTKEISDAIHGSLQMERTRLVRAQADIRERDKAKLEGSLIPEQRAREIIAEVLGPVRTGIASLPTLAPRCNPGEPAVAAAVLEVRARELLEASQTERSTFNVQRSTLKVRKRKR